MAPDPEDFGLVGDPGLVSYRLLVRLVDEEPPTLAPTPDQSVPPEEEGDESARRDVSYYRELVGRQGRALGFSYALGVISAFICGLSLAGYHRVLLPPAALLFFILALVVETALLVAMRSIYKDEFHHAERREWRQRRGHTGSGSGTSRRIAG